MAAAESRAMKIHVWDPEFVHALPTPRRRKRRTVSQILRAAYRRYLRDADTRQAVKRCLR